MKRLVVVLLALVACSGDVPLDADVPPTEAVALVAYRAKEWETCAERFTEVARRAPAGQQQGALYNAACCHALAGAADLAFAALDAAIADGWSDVDHVQADPDLVTLHADPRWGKAVAAVDARLAASMKAPQLRRELLAMVEVDQAARKAWIEQMDDPELAARVEAIDRKNTAALEAAIATYGWPGKSVVGDEGAAAAWLLVQHADRNPKLQKDVLAMMEPLVERGEVAAQHYAYLYDRVAVAEERPQRYGTQFKDRAPFPIEDEAHVDARRKAIGLGTMAEYTKGIIEMYGPGE
jgi:hypothetical protein